MERHTLSILVKNHAGVLSRVTGLFSRRGYNIDSLSVGVTEDEKFSRITIIVTGDTNTVDQITKQLNKLIDVVRIVELDNSNSVERGVMLVKVAATTRNRAEILQFADIFRANVVDLGSESITIANIGDISKQEALLNLLSPFGILEISKTGLAALQRGTTTLKDCR